MTRISLVLEERSSTPLYRQISSGLESLIEAGTLSRGSRLPSTRQLASTLRVSRCTITLAYSELARKRLIRTSSTSGTFVEGPRMNEAHCARDYHAPRLVNRDNRLSTSGDRLMGREFLDEIDAELGQDRCLFTPHPESLPYDRFARAVNRAHREARRADRLNIDLLGLAPLREEIRTMITGSRSIRCELPQIVIFSSAQIALEIIVRLLLDQGDLAIVENPGFPGARRTLRAAGARIAGIDVDNQGMKVDSLGETAAKLALVSPGRQTPTGACLSHSRRELLLDWARARGAYVLEDDFEAELIFAASQRPALFADDESESTIYLSSFWPILYPLSGLAYCVLPHSLIEPVRRAKALMDRNCPTIEQLALADFIRTGQLDRQAGYMLRSSTDDRNDLIYRLSRHIGDRIAIKASPAVSTILFRLNTSLSNQELSELFEKIDLPITSTDPFYLERPPGGEYLIASHTARDPALEHKLETLSDLLT
ncbi:MAG: PLP-dependent aminotransferase family protein [Candidatus Melainabacteria bacterium]|nr:PLP-dependent aminotransferase family protein [Candidatus Melainabacteria bacterium]